MRCRFCRFNRKNLTRVRPSRCPGCGRKRWEYRQPDRGQQRIHYVNILAVGESMLLPWDTVNKCYTTRYSQVLRGAVARVAKKYGRKFEAIRHIGGLKVTRIA